MEHLSLKIENHIGVVTLNKPPVNSLDTQLYQGLIDTFRSINANEDIWVVIFHAEGKHFCTGNDVSEFVKLTTAESATDYARIVSNGISSVYECKVPVIGAIRGNALGAGLAMASCCDVIVASENARFGIPEIKVGIVGCACFVSRMLPQQLHRYMAYSGDMMTAEQLRHYGAVLKVVRDDELMSSTLEVAEHLLSKPPRALKGFKLAMNDNENARLKEKYSMEADYSIELMVGTEDFSEALNAFLEKRKPMFKGK